VKGSPKKTKSPEQWLKSASRATEGDLFCFVFPVSLSGDAQGVFNSPIIPKSITA
jgi:hypothetical protein